MDMPHFTDINIENILVLVALSVALVLSLWLGQDNLAMSIATGLLGYIGGAVAKVTGKNKEDKKDESIH